jgi:hypothetical protein
VRLSGWYSANWPILSFYNDHLAASQSLQRYTANFVAEIRPPGRELFPLPFLYVCLFG